MSYAGKVAVITGGTSGIGKALAAQLASGGATVVIVGRDEAKGAATVAELGASGITFERADVTHFDSLKGVIDRVVERHGRLDYLFNNAGVAMIGEARDLDIGDWRHVIDIDLMGVVNGVSAAYEVMVRQGSGHIVNTSSLSGLFPTPGSVPYTAAKFGVVGLSHALRAEGAPLGVRVSVVCPAMVETPIFGATRAIGITVEGLRAAMPGKAMSAEDCARVILEGVAKNKATITPGIAGTVAALQRYAPFITNLIGKTIRQKIAAIRQPTQAGN